MNKNKTTYYFVLRSLNRNVDYVEVTHAFPNFVRLPVAFRKIANKFAFSLA